MAVELFAVVGVLAVMVAKNVAGRVAENIAGRVTDEVTSRALGLIIKTNQEQLTKLGQIDQKLSALLQGPFNTGMNYMEQAALPHRTATEQQAYLRRALDEFNRALGNETDNLERKAWIRWHIALCHELLNEHEDAKYHFAKCSEEAKQALAQMRSTYEAEMQKHNKAMEPVNKASDRWPMVLAVSGLVIAIPIALCGAFSLFANFTSANALVILFLGFIVIGLIRMLVSALNPKPREVQISPIMESLIKSVDHVRAMPGFASAQPDAA